MEIPDPKFDSVQQGWMWVGVSNGGEGLVSVSVMEVFLQSSRAKRGRGSLRLQRVHAQVSLDPNFEWSEGGKLTFVRVGPLKKSVHFLSTSPSATIFPFSSIPTWALCWKLPGSGSAIWSMDGANDNVVRRRTDLLHDRGLELGFTRAITRRV